MSLFQTLDSFPISCIYALVDDSTKGMYVYFSETAAIFQLSKAVMELKRGIHDNKIIQNAYNNGLLEVRVLKDYCESPPIEAVIRAECAHIVKNSGYTDLRGIHLPAYRIKKRVMTDYAYSDSAPPLVYVLAKSTTRDAIVMAICDNMIEADAWIRDTYGSEDSVGIIPSFALNERTREYHRLHGYKLIQYREPIVSS